MNKQVFTTFTLLAFFLFASATLASVLNDNFRKEIKDTRGVTKISVDNLNGDCHIISNNTSGLIVIANITVKGSSDESCEDAYRRLHVTVERQGNTIRIDAKHPSRTGFFGLGKSPTIVVDFNISMPRPVDVDVDLVNGDVNIRKMKSCSIDLINGNIDLDTILGASIDAINSTIKIMNLEEYLKADCINGGMQIHSESRSLQKISVDVVNGNIDAEIPCVSVGDTCLSSSTGTSYLKESDDSGEWKTKMRSKTIRLAEKGSAKISLSNMNGKVVLKCSKK